MNRFVLMGRAAVRGLHHYNGSAVATSMTSHAALPLTLRATHAGHSPHHRRDRAPWFWSLLCAWQLLRFELRLRSETWSRALLRWYVRLLQLLGRAPADLGVIDSYVAN